MEKIVIGKSYLKYTINWGDEEVPSFIIMHHIWVDESERMKGSGSELLGELNEVAKRENIYCIFILVTGHNKEFQNFLDKNDYRKHPNKELWWIRPLDYQHIQL